jgi:hypothetical protein
MMNHYQAHAATASGANPLLAKAPGHRRSCRLCTFALKREDGDDLEAGLCSSCKRSPDATALELAAATTASAPAVAAAEPFAHMVTAVTGGKLPVPPRAFSEADRALIRRIGAFMAPQKLLNILNERLACDIGSDDVAFTMDQLTAAIQEAHGGGDPTALGRDWPSIRKLLAQARRAGVLDQVNEQVISDFAVVFQLNAKQVVELKDIVLGAKED